MTPLNRALIVVDVQNEYVTGNLPIEYPPVEESLANIEKVIQRANQLAIPVIAIQHSSDESSPLFAKNSKGWQLHPVVTNHKIDKVVGKLYASIFLGTDLQEWLESKGVDTLTVIGYMTHNCNMATIIQASQQGFNIEFIQDAAGSVPYSNEAGEASAEEIHRTFSVVLHTGFAAVISTADWFEVLDGQQVISKSSIYKSNQKARISR